MTPPKTENLDGTEVDNKEGGEDKNKENWRIENIELLCYNCYFLYIGDVFNEKQIKHIEEDAPIKKDDQINWEMDENMLQHFQEIGLVDEDDSEDYISRI